MAIAIGYGAVGLVTLVLLARERPAKAKAAAPRIAGAVAWLALGAVPLALLAQWDSWRSPFPALWLGLVAVGLAGLARPWLAYAFMALRTAALVLAPTVSALVTLEPPPSASGMSFVRVARLQRTADLTREALLERFPTLPPGATISYWSRLAVTEIAFVPPKGPRVWYGDSTLTWKWLWRPGGIEERNDAVLSFDPEVPRPAVVIEPVTLGLVRSGIEAVGRGEARAGDSLLVAAVRAQSAHPSGQMVVWVARIRARIAYQAGAYDRAQQLNQEEFEMIGPSPEYYGMAALLALRRGDRVAAARLARLSLAHDAQNPLAQQAAAELAAPPR
jgi:hypothetical protein